MFLMETVMLFYVRYTTQKSGDVKILTFQDTMKIPLQMHAHFIIFTFQKFYISKNNGKLSVKVISCQKVSEF